MSTAYESCTLCPRMCGTNRTKALGFCRAGSAVKVARAALHPWEEPCISGKNGSGTVFFSGCTLKCIFCQNYPLSHENFGREITVKRLSEIFLELQSQGAHNINLVTATQYLPSVKEALDMIKGQLAIPVVFNCGGYERLETLREYSGYIDIYLPDLKYYDSNLAEKYSAARDYFSKASAAITEMIRLTGGLTWNPDVPSLLKKGVIIRHMVLPGAKEDSIRLLHWMKDSLPQNQYLLSLMSQYTPVICKRAKRGDKRAAQALALYPALARTVDASEYDEVLDYADELGFDEYYWQEGNAASESFIPLFPS